MRILFLCFFIVHTIIHSSDLVDIIVHCIVKNDNAEQPCEGSAIHQHIIRSVTFKNTVHEVIGKMIVTHDEKMRANMHLCELSCDGYDLMQFGKYSLRNLSKVGLCQQKNNTIHLRCAWSYQDKYNEKIYKLFFLEDIV